MANSVRRISRAMLVIAAAVALLVPVTAAVADEVIDPPAPTITGTPLVGATLTAHTPGWPADADLILQWTSDDEPIAGANSTTLMVPQNLADTRIRVEVTDGSEILRTSAPTLFVARVATPTVSGTYAVGSTLTARPGSWNTTVTFQWYANGKAISKATKSTYKLTKAQGSQKISVKATGKKAGYPTVTRASTTSAKVFTAAATPKVSGSAAVGHTLKAKKGTWMSGAKVSYRWYADGVAIKNATKSSYKITSAMATKRITVRTTGQRSGYATVVKTSAAKPKTQRIGKPKLGGGTVATKRLTVSAGSWVSGTTFSYTWYLNGKKISGAKSSSIYVKPSWKGKRLTAKVTGRHSGYSTFTVATSKSKKVTLPGRTDPVSTWNCPSWAPIKGNANSGIYHMPGQRFYHATKPEDCFSTQAAAVKAGYRKAKV